MRLDITLNADLTCNLSAYDNTDYEDLQSEEVIEHVFVEFMCYVPYSDEDNLTALDRSKKITTFVNTNGTITLDRNYTYSFRQDGRYRYYKYGLQTINHPGIYDGTTYNILNKIFWYDNNIYFGLANTTVPIFDTTNSKKIVNWYDLRNYTAFAIDYFFDMEIFTICKLSQCLVALQKEVIFEGLKNCTFGSCQKDKDIKTQRDFLFASLFVLNYLIAIGNYPEAQRILESLATCGSLCGDKLLKNNCNCGTAY